MQELVKINETAKIVEEMNESYKNLAEANKNLTEEERLNKSFEETARELSIGKENLKLLDEEEQPMQYLDLGISPDGSFFYYGKNLGGRESIITSTKKILRNTEEHFKNQIIGENQIKNFFDYGGYIGNIAPRWDNFSIRAFLTSVKKICKRTLYKKIRDKILYYMDYQGKDVNGVKYEDAITDVQVCWVIASFCYVLFYWFPHILFNAPSESGKSKNAFILMLMSFAGFDLGAAAGVTPAQIFRTLEGNRGTIWIDEFERRENSETQQLVNQILNASAARDAYIIRNEQIDKKWIATKFPIFCPKIVCNITGINPTSLSRFIVFSLLKTTTNKGKRKPYRKNDMEDFKEIRNELHTLILENWQEIRDIYENLDIDLSNREEDSWLPICAIAKWLGEDVLKNVMAYVKTYQEIKIASNDTVADFFSLIYEMVDEDTEYYTPKQIAEWVDVQSLLSHYKSPAHWIGRILKSYKFDTTRGGGVRKYLLSKPLIQNIVDRYFPDIMTQTPHNTTNNTNDTKQHNTTEKKDVMSENVSLCGISVVTPEVEEVDLSKNKQED